MRMINLPIFGFSVEPIPRPRPTVPQESKITPKVHMAKWVKYGLRSLSWHYLVDLRRNFEFGLSQV